MMLLSCQIWPGCGNTCPSLAAKNCRAVLLRFLSPGCQHLRWQSTARQEMGKNPNIRTLVRQIEEVEQGLLQLFQNSKRVLSPREMQKFASLRGRLDRLPALAENTERELWSRIDEYIRTPYTPRQLLQRRILAFLGWWVLVSMGIAQTVLAWFVSWFPSPLWMLATSAAIGFIAVALVALKERDTPK